MSPQRATVRSRRSSRRVAVVGAAGPAGSAVASALVAAGFAVIAVDDRRGGAPGTWRVGDVAAPGGAALLDGAHVVVHVAAADDLEAALAMTGPQRRAHAVRAARAVGAAARDAGAARLVVVTSAMVHGAAADNPVPLPDDAPVPDDGGAGIVGDLVEVEATLAALAHAAGLPLTVLRPAALVGPGVDSMVTRHFEAPRLLEVRGARAARQFCHVDDLGTAVVTALTAGLDGPLGVGCEGWLDAGQTARLARLRTVELPPALAFGTAERLHRVGVLPMPAAELAFVVHPWVVSSQRLRAAGWVPTRTNADCLTELLALVAGHRAVAGRRVEGREAAAGAAGAAVALLGAAALVRRARARRPGPRRPTL
ncbi:NAD-dependent epimerase/dehydratase family protein [Kineosporia sp. R_H_3]|uniref:NAD-dependent epimerase/dehydratase family protein n=1 Tax=Kineosporia sp. R_H_3 TaxID=1961848 RepID=UPI000B4A7325|nr:NAD-dependent epimerase/dehydratase family protein [Kineosporia sp. R_H_3]